MTLANLVVLKIEDVMSREVLTASEEDAVFPAVIKMHELGVGAIVVLDKAKHVTGIFTERDLMVKVVVPEKDPKKTCIADAMTKRPQALSSDMPILRAFQLLQSGSFRHVPVVDDGKLVGILSVRDLHRLVYDFMELVYDFLGRKR